MTLFRKVHGELVRREGPTSRPSRSSRTSSPNIRSGRVRTYGSTVVCAHARRWAGGHGVAGAWIGVVDRSLAACERTTARLVPRPRTRPRAASAPDGASLPPAREEDVAVAHLARHVRVDGPLTARAERRRPHEAGRRRRSARLARRAAAVGVVDGTLDETGHLGAHAPEGALRRRDGRVEDIGGARGGATHDALQEGPR